MQTRSSVGGAPSQICLHNKKNGSSKFYCVTQDGKQLTMKWGRIGSCGRVTHKRFRTTRDASEAKSKVVSQKRRRGYTPITSSSSKSRPCSNNTKKKVRKNIRTPKPNRVKEAESLFDSDIQQHFADKNWSPESVQRARRGLETKAEEYPDYSSGELVNMALDDLASEELFCTPCKTCKTCTNSPAPSNYGFSAKDADNRKPQKGHKPSSLKILCRK